MFQSIALEKMAPKKNNSEKKKRNGDAMMYSDRQNSYLKREKDKTNKKHRKKKDRLKYLLKKAIKQLLSWKENTELKELQREMKKN